MTGAIRVGVLGGTFDPIHVGHLAAAHIAQGVLQLSDVRFVPSYRPPHRPGAPLASAEERLAMIELAIAGTPGWRASELELKRRGASYTYDTLAALHAEGLSPSQIFFILGADAFAEIQTWSRYPAVLDAAHFVVIARHGTALERIPKRVPEIVPRLLLPGGASLKANADGPRRSDDLGASGPTRVVFIEADTPDVSSTMIRERVRRDLDITDVVTGDVSDYIARHGLYRTEESTRSHEAATGR